MGDGALRPGWEGALGHTGFRGHPLSRPQKGGVLVAQSGPTVCDPVGCSLPGSSVHGILQAEILEWVVIPFSRDLPAPGSDPGLLHCRQMLYRLSHQEAEGIVTE